jgi:hypothetical protein
MDEFQNPCNSGVIHRRQKPLDSISEYSTYRQVITAAAAKLEDYIFNITSCTLTNTLPQFLSIHPCIFIQDTFQWFCLLVQQHMALFTDTQTASSQVLEGKFGISHFIIKCDMLHKQRQEVT